MNGKEVKDITNENQERLMGTGEAGEERGERLWGGSRSRLTEQLGTWDGRQQHLQNYTWNAGGSRCPWNPPPGNHLSVRPSAYPPIGFFQVKSQPSTQQQLSAQIQAGCSPAKKTHFLGLRKASMPKRRCIWLSLSFECELIKTCLVIPDGERAAAEPAQGRDAAQLFHFGRN